MQRTLRVCVAHAVRSDVSASLCWLYGALLASSLLLSYWRESLLALISTLQAWKEKKTYPDPADSSQELLPEQGFCLPSRKLPGLLIAEENLAPEIGRRSQARTPLPVRTPTTT
jgi:hypothetical protein